MHDYWPFAVTLAVILSGILFNQRGLDRLEDRTGKRFDSVNQDLKEFRAEVTSRLDRIEADLREFYRTLGDHGARIDILEKKR